MPLAIHDSASGLLVIISDDYHHAALHVGPTSLYNTLLDARSHLWIKTTGEIVPVRPANERDYQLNELYTYCNAAGADPGGIETTHTCVAGLIMVVNDEGWIREPPLPYNPAASLLAGQPIAGNALVCPDRSIR